MVPVERPTTERQLADQAAELDELREQAAALEEEVVALRRRLQDAPKRVRTLEERLLETKGQLAQAVSQNEKLTYTLREAREHIAALREEVDKLTQPPAAYGTVLGAQRRRHRRRLLRRPQDAGGGACPTCSTQPRAAATRSCSTSRSTSCWPAPATRTGEVVTLKEVLERRPRPSSWAGPTRSGSASSLDELVEAELRARRRRAAWTPARACCSRSCPGPRSRSWCSRRCPTSPTSDVGGLDGQIEQIADAVELPFLHAELFAEHKLPAPKGILLYGPPGCGKTLIAKAVANSLAKKVAEVSGDEHAKSYFLNIKGPELLNKYVGETERQIRLVFQRAREKSEEGWPVIVFFDEMDSMFRTRGTGISSDMESHDRPAAARRDRRRRDAEERDRDRRLQPRGPHRPGHPAPGPPRREDQDRAARRGGGGADLRPLPHRRPARSTPDEVRELGGGDPDKCVRAMIERTVDEMYRDDEANQFLEVTYQNGDKEIMYFKDFSSGAMIENIVRRAKKLAIKRLIAGGPKGIRTEDLIASIHQEYKEHEDLPNTTNPDDWAKISGKKGERIVYVRTLIKPRRPRSEPAGGRAIERVATGQYL